MTNEPISSRKISFTTTWHYQITEQRQEAPLSFYSPGKAVPIPYPLSVSHQRNICKMKDLYPVKYFTCHRWGLQVPRLCRGFREGSFCCCPHSCKATLLPSGFCGEEAESQLWLPPNIPDPGQQLPWRAQLSNPQEDPVSWQRFSIFFFFK